MTWKTLAQNSPGASDKFGANDTTKIGNLFNGVADVDTVTLDSILRVKNSKFRIVSTGSGTPDYTIVNPTGTVARSLTVPNLGQNDTIAVLTEAQTMVGKTLTTPTIASILNGSGTLNVNSTGTITVPNGTQTLATLAGAETLSGPKTLTAPIISTITNGAATITLPTATGTLATLAGTEAISGKTITTSTIDAVSNTTRSFSLTPDVRRNGGWSGGAGAQGVGVSAGNVALLGGVATNTNSSTDGSYKTLTSGAVAGNQNGWLTNSALGTVCRFVKPRIKGKIRITSASQTAMRFFFGFQTGSTAKTGDTWMDGVTGLGFFIRSTDLNFKFAHNDGTATADYDVLGSGATAINSTINTFEITSDGTKFSYSVNGAAMTDVTTKIPTASATLSPLIYVETSEAVAKAMDVWSWFLEYDP